MLIIISLLRLASPAVSTQDWDQGRTVTMVRIKSFLSVRMNPPSALGLKPR